ncbi:hypothetical protein FACUT_11496 [Fusarium acutatum]|uniref:Uncharacterized protein n=1 Tax=Fusarium acutatum TaxID=78861 RepID=A0A8H4NKC2_9HYPO|nr:hypothetical protein FACUT_11496 [Fusarium acutatum]
MPHTRIPGFAALKRAGEASQDHPPETKDKGITFVESTSLRSIKTDKSSGLRIVNNSPGGGRQENVVAKVPGLEGTYAAIIDNAESLLEVYKMMPRGKLSIIVAVPPNGSGASMTYTEIPWSVLKAREDEAAATIENGIDEGQALDDEETVVGEDETVVGEDDSLKKGASQENDETTSEPTAANQPSNDPEALYPDLAGLII